MHKKKQDDNPDQDIEEVANGPTRPVRLRGSKRLPTANSRSARRKTENASEGIHERCNKRMNW